MDLEKICAGLRTGADKLALQTAAEKNNALKAVVKSLDKNRNAIFEANALDVKNAREGGMSESMIDRLTLDDKRLDGILESVNQVISQTDPVGEEIAGWKTPNGMSIRQVRVPFGVVAIIYENRPNVTVDAFCLAYKSGNAIFLRSSSSSINSNREIVKAIKEGLSSCECGIPEAIELAPCENHDEVDQIIKAVGKIDLVLPRGNKGLISTVVGNAKIPVIETGIGICHLYVDESADLEMAVNIAENGKIQRPGVCNALECIVVNKKIAGEFLPKMAERFNGRVKIHADEDAYKIFQNMKNGAGASFVDCVIPARDEDFGFEFLDYECAVKTVESVEEAVDFINAHNSKHSESIITNDRTSARLFQAKVDAACVYVNASTRFTDGGEFGFGAELGISTQKLHARGPMGISVLTTTKYIIEGDGQIR